VLIVTGHDHSRIKDKDQFHLVLDETLSLLPKLQQGLDVNVLFHSITAFEPTASLGVFDILKVPLMHGWTIDSQDTETYRLIVQELQSYNRVVECVIAGDVAESELLKQDAPHDDSISTTAHQDAVQKGYLYLSRCSLSIL
jgi:MINDY deubiquitinase